MVVVHLWTSGGTAPVVHCLGGTLVDWWWNCSTGTLLRLSGTEPIPHLVNSNQLVETNVEPNANTKAETFLPPERSRTNCFGVEIDGQYLLLAFCSDTLLPFKVSVQGAGKLEAKVKQASAEM